LEHQRPLLAIGLAPRQCSFWRSTPLALGFEIKAPGHAIQHVLPSLKTIERVQARRAWKKGRTGALCPLTRAGYRVTPVSRIPGTSQPDDTLTSFSLVCIPQPRASSRGIYVALSRFLRTLRPEHVVNVALCRGLVVREVPIRFVRRRQERSELGWRDMAGGCSASCGRQ